MTADPSTARENAAGECTTCNGTRKVPGMVMLDARHGAGWGVVPCPDCQPAGDIAIARDAGLMSGWGGFVVLFVAFVALIWGAVWLWHNTPPTTHDILSEKVRQCIADGGDPQFSSTATGLVADYYGCVKP